MGRSTDGEHEGKGFISGHLNRQPLMRQVFGDGPGGLGGAGGGQGPRRAWTKRGPFGNQSKFLRHQLIDTVQIIAIHTGS